jgi:hypothetical protein
MDIRVGSTTRFLKMVGSYNDLPAEFFVCFLLFLPPNADKHSSQTLLARLPNIPNRKKATG